MMQDYERDNAREWDLHRRDKERPPQTSNEDKWQVVGSSKTPGKKPQREPPPRAAGPLTKRHSNQRPSPQKWQNVQGRKDDISKPRRPPPPKLIDDADNEAQQAWRGHEPPKYSIRIPDHLVLQNRHHQSIARENGTFIFSEHAFKSGSAGPITFGIWGESSAVTATKRAINTWIEDCTPARKSGASAKFAKVVSLTPTLRDREERRWKREVKRQKFRQYPPPGMAFGAIASFHWPVAEYRPEEILGKSYEALDPIRMECSCYVVFVKQLSVFQVMGKVENVKSGLLRLRRTCFQITAKQTRSVRMYLLHWGNIDDDESSLLPSHVRLEPYDQVQVLSSKNDSSIEIQQGKSSRGEGVVDYDDLHSRFETQTRLSEERVQSSILKTLRRLHYYRGNIHMRIRLGTFLATQYKRTEDDVYTLDEYERMIGESLFMGQVTQELGNKALEQAALSTLQNSNNLLTPQDASPDDLSDVKPRYTGIFTLADEAGGDLRLSVSWDEATSTPTTSPPTFDQVSKKWTRLERDSDTPTSILDIALTDLHTGGGTAWQFDITASQAVDETRLSPALIAFANNLHIDGAAALKQIPDKSFVICNPYAYAVRLKSLQTRISYRYNLSRLDYTLELTKFQQRVFPERKAVFLPSTGEVTVYEPRWSLEVGRSEWDTMFSANGSLAVGDVANWSDDVDTWFPPAGDADAKEGVGFAELVGSLTRIGGVVRAGAGVGKADGVMEGMTVG